MSKWNLLFVSNIKDLRMKNKLIALFVALVIVNVSCMQEKENIEESSEFHLPTTISEEAKDVLKQWNRVDRDKGAKGFPKADAPIEVWEKRQAEFNEMAMEFIPDIIKDHNPQVDTIFVNGIRAIDVKPKGYVESDKVLLYIHGGAYVFFNAEVTLASSVPLADLTGLRIISIDYTLAPQAKFGQITDEVLQFYQGIIDMGYKPENISIYGDSAGGGLAAGSVLKMRDNGMPLPSSVVLWSPWADIDRVGDTYYTLAQNDPNLVVTGFLDNCAEAYAPRSEFKNPYVSPVYGDYSKDFPPTLIQVGGKEIFLSNSIRMYRALDTEGKEVKLDVYEGMWHVWQGYYKVPEAKLALENTKRFIFGHF